MVKAIVEIDKEADKVLKHLKVEYNLKDKSEAINLMLWYPIIISHPLICV